MTFKEAFDKYQTAIANLHSALNKQARDRLRATVTDAEVICMETLVEHAETALYQAVEDEKHAG